MARRTWGAFLVKKSVVRRRLMSLCLVMSFLNASCGADTQPTSTRTSHDGSVATLSLSAAPPIYLGLQGIGWAAAGSAILPFVIASVAVAPVAIIGVNTYRTKKDAERYASDAVSQLKLEGSSIDFSDITWYDLAYNNARTAHPGGLFDIPITSISFATSFTDYGFHPALDKLFAEGTLRLTNEAAQNLDLQNTTGLALTYAWANAMVNYAQTQLFARLHKPAPATITLSEVNSADELKTAVQEALAAAAIAAAQDEDNVALKALETYGLIGAYFLQGYIAGAKAVHDGQTVVEFGTASKPSYVGTMTNCRGSGTSWQCWCATGSGQGCGQSSDHNANGETCSCIEGF